ncbi:MAG TPA: 1-acyl-sn-glycerol-3-phosphate acyltransferase [Kofleriaceae bacterium]|nr:1-acyl-sn-glycerol-3-phosphate acyltransferase [Kofleriaceae bacterium]
MTVALADEAVAPGGGRMRAALVATFRRVMRLYFRDIERTGARPGPEVRGRVLVANHTNALIDAILVITDAACPVSPIAKSTLWHVPGLGWLLDRAGAVPIVRRVDAPDKAASANDAAFDRIAAHLAAGGNILIFPEGTSHSEARLAPLRTGAARILIAAAARGGVAPTFQAVGLEFEARTDFRSRCLVRWGPVRALVGGADVHAVTAQMASDLGDLLIEGESHDERRRIAHVAELLARDAGDATLGGWSQLGHQIELAHRTLRTVDAALVARVASRVDTYFAELARLGATDAQVVGAAPPPPRLPLVLAPLAAAGFVLYALPYFVPRRVARRSDADAVSTIKLGAALVVYPVWMAGLVIAALVALPAPWSWLAAAVAVTSPFAALRWLDAWYQRAPALGATDRARLGAMRRAACEAIDAARRRLPS